MIGKKEMSGGSRAIRSGLKSPSSLHYVMWSLILWTMCVMAVVSSRAEVTVNISGPGGNLTQSLPDGGGAFALDLPLTKNAVNNISVTASDIHGNRAQKDLNITQVSLDNVVISEFTSEPLSVERIEQLVNDGVIDLEDPENYNVSMFTVVLTIGNKPVPISVPVATPINNPEVTGYENIRLPRGGDSSGNPSNNPELEIVIFEEPIPSGPGEPALPPVPGILIIEGRIKSLKEFYSCRLLLMNASGIFTLSDITAILSFPDGGLSNILPVDGVVSFGSILPGDGAVPGQVEKEFIIRGDEIGVRRVQVNFGGLVTGPGIPDDAAIPFNGSALTTVEVKGPPTFQVEVFHPDYVVKDEPYELRVDITNTGDMPALYTSLELDVGGDGQIVQCKLKEQTGEIACDPIEGPSVRNFGHILPGQTVSETVLVNPLRDGRITSCMGISDQNINLQVYVGDIGCLTGNYPPIEGSPDGRPTVTVLPYANAQAVGLDSPVAAFFSELIRTDTITAGENGSFKVFNEAGEVLPGVLRFDEVMEKTVALWQHDVGGGRLPANTELTVKLGQTIADLDGNFLYNEWTSTFTTTGEYYEDDDAPTLSLTVQPPTDPNFILPGELVRVNAYAADQGSGVVRVETRLKDLDDPESTFTLRDQRSVLLGDEPPYIFSIDTITLVIGHAYLLQAIAYDYMGNMRESMLALTMADSADPPTLVLPASPVEAALQGISINITPLSYTGGVREIRYYLDGAVEPFSTAFLRPYQTFIRTLALPLGAHEVRAVAVDGLGQTGESSYAFELAENKNMPVVNFGAVSDGVLYTSGSVFVVNIGVDDPVGIASVYVYLDNSKADPITSGTTPFVVDTDTLSLGAHHITVVATNLLGVSNDPGDPDSVLEFSVVEPPPGEPPAAPVVTNTPLSENGMTTVEGTTVAGARVDVSNSTLGLTLTAYADGAGRFSANLQADPENILLLVAYDFSQSQEPSPAATVVVGRVPVLDHIEVQPATVIFTSFAQYQDLIVMGHYEDGSTKNLTSRAVFTSSAMGIAGINAAGRVAPIANGAAIITADVEGKQAAVQVTVNVIILTHISVTPDPVVLIAISETRHLAVTAHYSDDSNRPAGAGLTFVSSDASIATVNSAGVVTAVREGETAVTVYLPGAAPVVVPVVVDTTGDTAPEVEILSPANGAQVERGQSVSITVQGVDTVGGVARFYIELSGAMTYAEQVQVEPPSLSVIKAFPVVIAANAAIGGIITVTVRAEDSGGNLSETLQRMLVVVDGTAPSVSVVEPVPMSGYNYDDTVTVRVSATDAVGVTEIHYFTQGAFEFSGAQNVTPPATGAEAVFTFRIPYGVTSPDVRIRAFAKDAAGNEGAAIPVDITITDADITAPQTVATAASAPGASTVTVVTCEVTEGLDDLDHVELYFRRDGFGTFNRYTNATGGNPLGQFVPQSGAMGTIEFDSTRMGGDGQYEFYTVGVDQAGNREAPPTEFIPTEAEGEGEGEGETEGEGEIPGEEVVVADQSVEIHAGTVWVEITVETALGPEATDYDGKNIRVIGVPFVLSGHHSFHNIELIGGATLAHPQTDAELEYELDLDAWTLTIDADSAVDVSGRGYLGGYRPGVDSSGRTLGNTAGSTYRSAGSYGGPGAADGGTPNPLYGNLVQPADLGSGGSGGIYSYFGGDGGGRIQVQAINIIVDGSIASGGENGSGYNAGSGSGGAIFLAISTLSGTGAIRANGGGGEVGGGGGRVAIHYVDMATMDTSLIAALGGQGSRVGGNGTVFLKGVEENSGTLVIDGQGVSSTFSMLSIPPGYIFDNIIIRNEARVVADMPLEVNDTLSILTGSILTHTRGNESGLQIIADHIYVDETSSMDLSAKGYRGGNREGGDSTGLTLGGIAGAQYRSGGSYGGYGGVLDGAGSNPPYGSPLEPVYLGSGGSGGVYGYGGGHGGGRADLTARKSLHVDGAICANGEAGYGYAAGSGSGGSIRITTSLLKGGGVITANGGANEVGGSGGRVAIAYDYVSFSGDDFGGLRNITAWGGHGGLRWGSAGTVLLVRSDQARGDLYVDDGIADATSSAYTPLTPIGFGKIVEVTEDTLTADGGFTYMPSGLVGLDINPNTNQAVAYRITGNTETTITVDITGKAPLNVVADIGDMYVGVYRFDNVYFRRGGYLVLGDRLEVSDTLRIDECGLLTHYDARAQWESRLEITASAIEIGVTSSINVDQRGCLGGYHADNAGSEGLVPGGGAGATYRAGASHGGLGGRDQGAPNAIYGNITAPAALGAGGSGGTYSYAGGDGGGWIQIWADALLVEGGISANGGPGTGYHAGSGAGGSIYIHTGSLSGGGTIYANGGGNEIGGGGGRIAIHYTECSLDASHIMALGGHDVELGHTAGNGTVFLKGPGQSFGDLVIDGNLQATPSASTPLPEGYTFNNILLRNQACVVADTPVRVLNMFSLTHGSVLTHSPRLESGLVIQANTIEVDADSAIDISGKGYPGGYTSANGASTGLTLGGLPGAQYRSGGSYGGLGAVVDGGTLTNPIYGHPANPIYLGSGGSAGTYSSSGGNGGGRLTITAGTIRLDGALCANGTIGAGYHAGSGSGGSILIETSRLEGTGVITANGGSGEVSGGGGRIAVTYATLGGVGNDLNGLANITAYGGSNRSAGTVLVKQASQPYGDLYVDAGLTDTTSDPYTPLTHIGFGVIQALTADTITTDGIVRMVPNGLAGLEINPNLEQEIGYTVLSNTEATITVDPNGKPALDTVAAPGDTYAGIYRFDNVFVQNGGFLVMGDRLIVQEDLLVDTYGRLTHFDASSNFESRLEVYAGAVYIAETGSVNVDSRGYLGGGSGANGENYGLTLGNILGASYRSGGSYGGYGAALEGIPNPVYGDPLYPAALGSGGSRGGYSAIGGDGGGWVYMEADTVAVDGALSANGGNGGSYTAGSGSGGTIRIVTGDFLGTGAIQAHGGASETGGGGGRIAIDYVTLGNAGEDFDGLRNITAFGGQTPSYPASAGTVVLRRADQARGDLYIDDGTVDATARRFTPLPHIGFGKIQEVTENTLVTDGLVRMLPNGLAGLNLKPDLEQEYIYAISGNTDTAITVDLGSNPALNAVAVPGDTYSGVYVFDNMYFRRGGALLLGDPLLVPGLVMLDEYGRITHYNATTQFESRLEITAGAMVVGESGAIITDGRGYLGGYSGDNANNYGLTLGNLPGSTYRSGGSYGGLGGSAGGVPNLLYGDPLYPVGLGSGGSSGGYSTAGGNGGGWIWIHAGELQLEGRISASGAAGGNYEAGSGSGGSVLIYAPEVSGAGAIAADGGGNDVGGGGGRIAVYYKEALSDVSTITVTASGGATGADSGQDGTVNLVPGEVAPPEFDK